MQPETATRISLQRSRGAVSGCTSVLRDYDASNGLTKGAREAPGIAELRLTADGKLRTCLFSLDEQDLKPLLRGGASDDDLAALLQERVRNKEAGHKIGQADFVQPQRSMSCIGG